MANLLTNPGFETGNTNGWTTTGSPLVDTTAPRTGTYNLGIAFNDYTAYQDVDISAYSANVDAGLVTATMSAWARNTGVSEGDTFRVRLQYLNASDTILAEDDTGNIAGVNATYVETSDSRTCPSGTRKLRVYLYGNEAGTSNADIRFDDCSVEITVLPLPDMAGIINFI